MTNPTQPITEALVDQLRMRAAVGLEKYGVTLDRHDIDLEGWLQHMLEELLDGAGYAMAAMRKVRGLTAALIGLIDAVENTDEIPATCCNCASAPPCNDCVEWSLLREAMSAAKAAIATPKAAPSFADKPATVPPKATVIDKLLATAPMPDLPMAIRCAADRITVAANNPSHQGGPKATLDLVKHEARMLHITADRVRDALAAQPVPAQLKNPHTGQPRDPRDVTSDPQGILIHKAGTPLRAATPTVSVEISGAAGIGKSTLALLILDAARAAGLPCEWADEFGERNLGTGAEDIAALDVKPRVIITERIGPAPGCCKPNPQAQADADAEGRYYALQWAERDAQGVVSMHRASLNDWPDWVTHREAEPDFPKRERWQDRTATLREALLPGKPKSCPRCGAHLTKPYGGTDCPNRGSTA